ncbi:MAG TPA: PH domain-containing protein [Trebonia sp.]|nr:PH domain-containing protein [Trebonia sp.]
MPGQDREVIRLAPPVALWWVWVAFVAANVADYAVQGLSSARFGAEGSALLLFVTGLMYTLALRPRVVVDGAGVTVVNPFRVHRIPWRVITAVDTGDWMRIRYRAGAGEPGGPVDRTLHCWALYVSARARRKIARGPSRPRRALVPRGFAAPPQENSRLPEEARYLASLPVAKAVAIRLDTRAERERSRGPAAAGQETTTASWSWFALAAVVVPALVLLVVLLA